jgi:hypothetical protein
MINRVMASARINPPMAKQTQTPEDHPRIRSLRLTKPAAALALVAGALVVSQTALAQKQKKEDWNALLRDNPGVELCLNSRTLAPNIDRSTNCRKQGVMPYNPKPAEPEPISLM